MLREHEIKTKLKNLEAKLDKIQKYLQIDNKRSQISLLKIQSEDVNFWSNQDNAKAVMQKLKTLEGDVSAVENTLRSIEDLSALVDVALAEEDKSLEPDILESISKIESDVSVLEFRTLFSGPYDSGNAIFAINAGAGGTDAQDWAQILLRMYSRYFESKGFSAEIADISYGEEAGIKSATLIVSGEYVFGNVKGESGVHRMVRISPFDANKRRHTSFASIEVIPEISSDVEVNISDIDLKIDTFRSSGPGGQNVQKTESAVRITHIPTGIVAQSQNDRSQHKNKETALKILKARIYERMVEEKKEKIEELRGEQKDIAWGNQIRSYVFQPYTLVKDHRTGVESGNVTKVLDGDLDLFIEAFLQKSVESKKEGH